MKLVLATIRAAVLGAALLIAFLLLSSALLVLRVFRALQRKRIGDGVEEI